MAQTKPASAPGGVRRVGRVIANLPGAGVVFAPPRAARFAVGTWVRSRRVGDAPVLEAGALPAPRLSWSLAAQVALDETVLGVAKSPRWYPTDRDLELVAAELRAAVKLARRRGWLDAPQTYHRDPLSAADPVIVPASHRGLRYERLSWTSGYEPHDHEPGRERWLGYEANRTAHAMVLRHPGKQRPWLVCLHGFGVGTALTDFYAFRAARLHHEHGLNVLIPVLPLHGPRKASRLGGIEMMSFQLQNFVMGMAQAMWDVRRAIRWARGEGATRIGVHGMSLGGYTGALLSTLEPGLDMVIAGAPLSDIPKLYASHSPPRILAQAVRHGIVPEATEQAFSVVSPLAAPPLVPKERLFVYAGVGDRLSRPEQAHALWEHWDRPRIEWYPGGHMTFVWSKVVGQFLDEALRDSGFLTPRKRSKP